MSFVIAAPEVLAAATGDLSGIGEALRAAAATAAAPTTGIAPLAGDEVSAAITRLFGSYAQDFQALSARTALFHAEFVQALQAGAGAYTAAEAANVSPLQTIENDILAVINSPTNLLLGRPLIGNGTDGAPGTGSAGGAGGIVVRQWRAGVGRRARGRPA
ncbi:PE domain-containing protein, partial [Mycobacterium szulgai]